MNARALPTKAEASARVATPTENIVACLLAIGLI